MPDKPPKGKPSKGKSPRRRRFLSPEQIRANLQSISNAQSKSRENRKKLAKQQIDAPAGVNLPIIEDITKSRQALKNELRRIRRPEDLADYE